MYPRLLLNFCERFLYRVTCNHIRLNVKRASYVASEDEKERKKVEPVSMKFPDYEVIYRFPFIKLVASINIMKRRFTVLTAAVTPVIFGLHLASILSFDITIVSITTGVLTTVWLHSLGIFCNNLIGYVYLKLDEEKVILSYVDYWGKRIDLQTLINEITPMSDNPISITDPLFRKIILSSQKQNLKINLKLGQITNVENFRSILGMN
ncbi:transmembrane protein 186 [Monomorium pharaonis]|uniref:transmembrane protein 186 n=1 Tax=Monomorium pharaonis TaxID=307658 RepID=UPI00063F35BF|nr:transmembrane protein 186 [Monomorium pharaonis]